ncbi:MAG: hypothetical protein QXZ70_09595, partial [Candidatus Bathyarchaeia archaeon]
KLENYVQAAFEIPIENGTMQFLSWIHTKADVKQVNFNENSLRVIFESTPAFAANIQKRVEALNGKFEIKNQKQG